MSASSPSRMRSSCSCTRTTWCAWRAGLPTSRARARSPSATWCATHCACGRCAEDGRVHGDPVVRQPLEEGRADAGGTLGPAVAALGIDPGAVVEGEDVRESDDLALHAADLGDMGDAAAAVTQTGQLHDDVDRARDLLANRPARKVH